jgi:hypothetical protein
MRLLLLKTVAAVDAKKMAVEAESLYQMLAEAHGLVGEHSHLHVVGEQFVQRLTHARI